MERSKKFINTSVCMVVLSHELTINPEIQGKLQAEIDEVMAKFNGKLAYDSIINMSYLDAIFNEALKLHSIIPFL